MNKILTYEEKQDLLATTRFMVARHGTVELDEVVRWLQKVRPQLWQKLGKGLKRFSAEVYLTRFVLAKFATRVGTHVWQVQGTSGRCRCCLQEQADANMDYRIDQFGGVFCDDHCYDVFLQLRESLAEVDDSIEWEDDENHPYYYEYSEVRELYVTYHHACGRWQKAAALAGKQNAKKQRERIEEGANLAEQIFQSYEQFAGHIDGDDGPFAAAIADYVHGLQQLLQQLLLARLHLVYGFWQRFGLQELEERANGHQAFAKATRVIDEVERMYRFYCDELPAAEGAQLAERFQPIFVQMLDWRPKREMLYPAFGISEREGLYFLDPLGTQFRKLLLQAKEEEDLFMFEMNKFNWEQDSNYISRAEDDEELNMRDFTWVFAWDYQRDLMWRKWLPYFMRPEHRAWLWDEEEGRHLELVTFFAVPCECGCELNYARAIDEPFYQTDTDGWFVCHRASNEWISESDEKARSILPWESETELSTLRRMHARRSFRRAGLAVPDWAYEADEI